MHPGPSHAGLRALPAQTRLMHVGITGCQVLLAIDIMSQIIPSTVLT